MGGCELEFPIGTFLATLSSLLRFSSFRMRPQLRTITAFDNTIHEAKTIIIHGNNGCIIHDSPTVIEFPFLERAPDLLICNLVVIYNFTGFN